MTTAPERKRYHLNVAGDFYVEDKCCAWCGIPAWAPTLFENDNERHDQCFVKKQPGSAAEIDEMISVMWQQELGCIRYAGRDPKILRLLAGQLSGDPCDELVRDPALRRDILNSLPPGPVDRVCALARDRRATGASVNQLLRDSGIGTERYALTPDNVLHALRKDPSLVDDWIEYSADKRTVGGLYFRCIDDGRYEVGSARGQRWYFDDRLVACATFIVGEFRPEPSMPWWRRWFGRNAV